MRQEALQRHFASIGARVKFRTGPAIGRWRMALASNSLTIDLQRDKRGEFFEITLGDQAPDFEILQVKPQHRHLLLYARDGQRFLCGFDERHWFVAGIEGAVSTIRAAKQSLMPSAIREQAMNLSSAKIENRRNAVFIRQGEWFFVPVRIEVPAAMILRDEPLRRTMRNKPHICQELYREGGEFVYIVNGKELTPEEFAKRKLKNPAIRPQQTMVRNPTVYARGYVKHDDHATIKLKSWHRVFLNAEFTTAAVTFLD
jgi:hypothetical protein